MKAQDKPKFVAESRTLLESLSIEKLISEPNDLNTISKINRLIAIFTNFSSNDGQELKRLFQEFQKWARRSTQAGTIKNKAVDVFQFIGQKIEEMDIYVIEDEVKRKKQDRVIKELKDENLFVRSVLEGKDMHLFISEKGNQEHSHLIFDAITGEIRVDPKDQEPIELVEKVVSVTTKTGKVIEASMRGLETSLQFKSQQELVSDPPILYVLSNVGHSGGSNGHFATFILKNIGKEIALDIHWGIRAFDYEWRSQEKPFELEPNKEKEVVFQISREKIFTEAIPELNIIMEYKDPSAKAYFTRRELVQEKVPSGAFFNLRTSTFHPPSVLVDDGLKLVAEPFHNGDRIDAIFEINTKEGIKKVTIGMSRSLCSVLGFENDSLIKQALLELGHRKIRKMVKENDLKDHMFSTYELPEQHEGGFNAYIKLRDSIT